MRDLMNLRHRARPFDDIKARAQQPTQFNQTLAGNYSEAVVLWQSALVMGAYSMLPVDFWHLSVTP